MKQSEVLRKARDLILDQNNWIRGLLMDKSDPTRPRYCAVGALHAAVNCPGCMQLPEVWAKIGICRHHAYPEEFLLQQIAHEMGFSRGIVNINDSLHDDHLAFAKVHECYEKAIKLAEEQEQNE